MTLVELHSQKKETAFVFEECFKNLPYTSSLFLLLRIYTDLVVIDIDRAENRSALV